MRIGVHLANWGAIASAERIVKLSLAAETLGFDSVWVTDHVVIPAAFESVYPLPAVVVTPETAAPTFEPLMTLAVVAGATNRIRLGTSVLVSAQRDPMLAAKQLTTLDVLSGGRLDVGVGAGWLEEEFDILGASFADRGAVLDEHIRIFRRLWSGESAEPSFDGRLCRFPPIRFDPLPVQPGGPPITVGGFGRSALRRAATLADGWQPINLTPDDAAPQVAELRRLAAEAGRTQVPQVLMRCPADLVDDTADGEGPPLVGPAEKIIDSVIRYAEAGVTGLLITPAPGKPLQAALETLERISAEVLPAVSDVADEK